MENLGMKQSNCISYKRMMTTRDSGLWHNSDSMVYTYDKQMRVIAFLEYDGTHNSWVPLERGEMRNDDRGNPSTMLIYHKDSKFGWRLTEEKDYLLDSLGKFSVEL